jgi:hypothetical protein
MAAEPNQGATADAPNQGAPGARPPGGEHSARPSASRSVSGETPLQADAADPDPFAERPEAFVGAAFAGGLVLALLLRRWAS